MEWNITLMACITGTFSKHGPLKGKTVYFGQNNNHKPNVDEEENLTLKASTTRRVCPRIMALNITAPRKIKYEGFFLNGKFYNNGKVTFGNGFDRLENFVKVYLYYLIMLT